MALGLELRQGVGGRATRRHAARQQGRLVVVCMGRNDGASGKKRSARRDRKPASRDFSGPEGEGEAWYEEVAGLGPSSRASAAASAGRLAPPPPPPAQSWERGGGPPPPGADPRRGRGGRAAGRGDDDESDEEDGRGWWERPEERSLQAYAAPRLEPWQEQRLCVAYAGGRRKVQVQELSRQLGVDRSVVLGWMKDFAARPADEREAALAGALAEAEAARAKEAGRAAAEAATGAAAAAAKMAAAAARVQGGGGGGSGGEAATGFVPFYLRKQLGAGTQRRISGEALRTLEAIYDRTPFPSADVVRGLYELHRLPREVAVEWFAARREADGIGSSSQKRDAARPSLRQRDRDLSAAFTDGPDDDDGGGGGGGAAAAGGRGQQRGARDGAAARAGGARGGAPASAPAAAAAAAEPLVVSLSAREMAALRSSLPSPDKHKGRQLAETAGLQTGAGSATTQIGSVQFVAAAPDAEEVGDKVRASWRYRAGATAPGGRRLRLRGRGPGRGESSGEEQA